MPWLPARGRRRLAGCLERFLGRRDARRTGSWSIAVMGRVTRELNRTTARATLGGSGGTSESRALERVSHLVIASEILKGDRLAVQQQCRALTGPGVVEFGEGFVVGQATAPGSPPHRRHRRPVQYLHDIAVAALGASDTPRPRKKTRARARDGAGPRPARTPRPTGPPRRWPRAPRGASCAAYQCTARAAAATPLSRPANDPAESASA